MVCEKSDAMALATIYCGAQLGCQLVEEKNEEEL